MRTVHYRFHPRAGEQVEVVRRHERKYLVVRQPDGTLAYLPEWMTSPRAASFDVGEVPALAREALSELRGVILAHGCNLGLYTMEKVAPDIAYRRLKYVSD